MLHGTEDYAEVPPIDDAEGGAARSLLQWALTGQVPNLYRPYAAPGPLLAGQDGANIAAVAQNLQAGSRGNDLVSYGTALMALSKG